MGREGAGQAGVCACVAPEPAVTPRRVNAPPRPSPFHFPVQPPAAQDKEDLCWWQPVPYAAVDLEGQPVTRHRAWLPPAIAVTANPDGWTVAVQVRGLLGCHVLSNMRVSRLQDSLRPGLCAWRQTARLPCSPPVIIAVAARWYTTLRCMACHCAGG